VAGLIFFAIAVAAAIRLDGTFQIVAIVVAALNGLSLVGQFVERNRGETPSGTTLLNFLTAIAGVGLFIYSFI
jgi:hypothetical protein